MAVFLGSVKEDKIKKNWIDGNYKFVRDKNYSGVEMVVVYIKDGKKWVRFTDIKAEDMIKKKLNFYSNKDIIYFNKNYR